MYLPSLSMDHETQVHMGELQEESGQCIEGWPIGVILFRKLQNWNYSLGGVTPPTCEG